MDSTSTTGTLSGRDRGSSTVEYSLMVAALAAALVGVIMGAGAIASEGLGTACSGLSSALSVTGDCTGTRSSTDLGTTTSDS